MGLKYNYHKILARRIYRRFEGWRLIDIPEWVFARLTEVGRLQDYWECYNGSD